MNAEHACLLAEILGDHKFCSLRSTFPQQCPKITNLQFSHIAADPENAKVSAECFFALRLGNWFTRSPLPRLQFLNISRLHRIGPPALWLGFPVKTRLQSKAKETNGQKRILDSVYDFGSTVLLPVTKGRKGRIAILVGPLFEDVCCMAHF